MQKTAYVQNRLNIAWVYVPALRRTVVFALLTLELMGFDLTA